MQLIEPHSGEFSDEDGQGTVDSSPCWLPNSAFHEALGYGPVPMRERGVPHRVPPERPPVPLHPASPHPELATLAHQTGMAVGFTVDTRQQLHTLHQHTAAAVRDADERLRMSQEKSEALQQQLEAQQTTSAQLEQDLSDMKEASEAALQHVQTHTVALEKAAGTEFQVMQDTLNRLQKERDALHAHIQAMNSRMQTEATQRELGIVMQQKETQELVKRIEEMKLSRAVERTEEERRSAQWQENISAMQGQMAQMLELMEEERKVRRALSEQLTAVISQSTHEPLYQNEHSVHQAAPESSGIGTGPWKQAPLQFGAPHDVEGEISQSAFNFHPGSSGPTRPSQGGNRGNGGTAPFGGMSSNWSMAAPPQVQIQLCPKEPPCFYGKDHEDAENFIRALADYFDVVPAPEAQRVNYSITLLQERAKTWYSHWEAQNQGLRPASFGVFRTAFLERFGNPLREEVARAQLRQIKQRQGETTSAFVSRFTSLLDRTSHIDERWMTELFIAGLPTEHQKGILHPDPRFRPVGLQATMNAALQIDHTHRFISKPTGDSASTSKNQGEFSGNSGGRGRGRGGRGGRGGGSVGQQQTSGTNNAGNAGKSGGGAKQNQGRGELVCYNCGGKGHIASKCPSPSQQGQGRGQGRGRGRGHGNRGRGRGATMAVIGEEPAPNGGNPPAGSGPAPTGSEN